MCRLTCFDSQSTCTNTITLQLEIVCIAIGSTSKGRSYFFQLLCHNPLDEKRKRQVEHAGGTEQIHLRITCNTHLCARLRGATDDRERLKQLSPCLQFFQNKCWFYCTLVVSKIKDRMLTSADRPVILLLPVK